MFVRASSLMEAGKNLLRELPSVDRLLNHPRCRALLAGASRDYVTRQCRALLDELRAAIRAGKAIETIDEESLLAKLAGRIALERGSKLTRVVNATGTILHTNLGRALLPQAAIDAAVRAGQSPVNLEYDLEKGARGKREEMVESLLRDLTGAEAASVVNNNAAAVLLGLNTLAEGREVIVSRGELIEIGGSFRIPEIMAKSGAILKEVGSTNRTHPQDYEKAIGKNTALLLKVHTSNYKIVGFSAEVSLEDMVAIGKKHNVPVMEDLGSGAIIDLSRHGLPKEPLVAERVALGADVVTFSGDKILGGPQAGLVVGRKNYLQQMNKNPLQRALRSKRRCVSISNPRVSLQRSRHSGPSRVASRISKPRARAFCRRSKRRWEADFTRRSKTRPRRSAAARCRPKRSQPR